MDAKKIKEKRIKCLLKFAEELYKLNCWFMYEIVQEWIKKEQEND